MATEAETEKLGRYEILSELGRGAMGVVYKAVDPLIDRTVAIKTIKFDLSADDCANFEERFYREAKSAGRLNHPNIVTIYDVGKSEDTAYIAMELLEGQLLKEILDVHAAMSIDKIVHIAAQIADGLSYAHKNGIVHRDIKPANIMLLDGDMVKITDFGIARMSTSSGTLAGTVMGSPRYMAPEQVVGKAVDGRSDVFALGVVLYEMLTGESPFDGDNINTTMYRIVNEASTPPRTLNPRIPEVFDFIVAKALAKHPDHRYQSARELASDLRNYKDLSVTTPIAVFNHPITLDRKPTPPKNNAGEQTVFLPPAAALTKEKRVPAPGEATVALAAAPAAATAPADEFLLNPKTKKILIAVGVVLAIIFTLNVMRNKPGAQSVSTLNQPSQNQSKSLFKPAPVARPSVISQAEPDAPPDLLPHVEQPEFVAPAPKPAPAVRRLPVNPPTAPAAGTTLLTFAITPWGDVYLDGKRMGASPPLTVLRVPAGKHKIEIRNLNFTPYSQTLNLQANSSKKIKHIFE